MILELRHLRSLQAIHEAGNLALAAQRLHLTQSALSHQIKTIEHYFDTALFLRKNKPLRFTPAGQRLLKLALHVLPDIAAAEAELKRIAGGEAGRLHITIECHSCFEWLVPTLDHYRQQWPEVEVDIRLGTAFDPMPSLSNGDIDLVITSDQQQLAGLSFQPLFEFEGLVVMNNAHPLTERDWIAAEDFNNEVLITYPVPEQRLDIFKCFLHPNQVKPKAVRQVELTAMILQLVVHKRGIAVLPDWLLAEYLNRQYISARPIGECGMKGQLYAAVRQTQLDAPYLKAFIDLAKQRKFMRAVPVDGV